MSILAAIDIGSNAMRLLVGTVDRTGTITNLENLREPVRLGQDVFSGGVILDETQERAIEALKRFQQMLKRHGCERWRAVGTSALREARNRTHFLNRVAEELGISIDLIEGDEEARLIHLAVSRAIDLSKGSAVLIDIGGGSVEISLTSNGDVVFSDSMKMGTVRLLQMLGEKKMAPAAFGRLVRRYAEGIHRRLELEHTPHSVDICVGTGGNIEALTELGKRRPTGKGHRSISFQDLSKLVDQLVNLSVEERMKKFSLRPDRADVIVPAGVVVLEVMRHVGATELISPGVGLKDGVLIDLIPSLTENKGEYHRRQVLTFARALGRRYDFDEPHAERVTAHALAFFDQSKKEHGLDKDDRLLLEVAGLLHDIGTTISVNSHHKHSWYLINATPFVGLNKRERGVVALIARYHRKSLPSEDHESFKELAPKDRERVCKLAAFLRLAEALERAHGSTQVTGVQLDWQKDKVILSFSSSDEFLMEEWAVHNKSDLFEKAYGRKLIVRK